MVLEAGPGSYIFIADAEDAYYRLPIVKYDHKYMGIKFAKHYWFFTCVQMGLSSGCYIYNTFADAIEYIIVNNNWRSMYKNGIQLLRHYLDDFFGVHKDYLTALHHYHQILYWFRRLGVPTKAIKCKLPSQIQKILGWYYDTIRMVLIFPPEKAKELIPWLDKLINCKFAHKKELEKLIGNLQRASIAIFPGKAFLRRLERHLYTPGWPYNQLRQLDRFTIMELSWWKYSLLQCVKGIPLEFIVKDPKDCDIHAFSDASSTRGIGGWTCGHYFQLMWYCTNLMYVDAYRGTLDIHCLELMGTIIMAEIFGPQFTGQAVCFWIDNTGAAGDIRSKAPKLWRHDLQYLIRRLAKAAIKYQFMFYVMEIEGDRNGLADALSRNYDLTDYMSPIQCEMWKKYSVSEIVEDILQDLMNEPINGKETKVPFRNLNWEPLSTDPTSPSRDVNTAIGAWCERKARPTSTNVTNNDIVTNTHNEWTVYI